MVTAMALQLPEEEAATRLIRLREAGYWSSGGGEGGEYELRRDLADRLRGRATVDSIFLWKRKQSNCAF